METIGPQVALEPIAKDQEPVLLNLFELYVHDFSEHVPLDIRPNGRFDIPLGDQWWTGDDHFPFFIRWNGKLTGFALARKGSRLTDARDVMDIAEFFVLRGGPRQGGRRACGSCAIRGLPRAMGGSGAAEQCRGAEVLVCTAETWIRRPVSSRPVLFNGADWDVLQLDALV